MLVYRKRHGEVGFGQRTFRDCDFREILTPFVIHKENLKRFENTFSERQVRKKCQKKIFIL